MEGGSTPPPPPEGASDTVTYSNTIQKSPHLAPCCCELCEACLDVCTLVTASSAASVTVFRICVDRTLKAKLDEWNHQLCYTSNLQNLLHRHFKKVTVWSWFAEDTVLVLADVSGGGSRPGSAGSSRVQSACCLL